MRDFNSILKYWFDGITDDDVITQDSPLAMKWFSKNENTDNEIRQNFESDLLKASNGEYEDWKQEIRGQLALVILFDQFSRNMYRNTPEMFETDKFAINITSDIIGKKSDVQLQCIERIFLYMPMMHSEEMKIQETSVLFFKALSEEIRSRNPRNVDYYENTLEFARRHFSIIKEFGRFPHRNAILGRKSNDKELEFLEQPGSSF